ncbi:MAG: NPCBM/NEW2 domain-containing protein [Kiritimatiellae bacterium]|nr:NPCBM/NEW2 domain-containing protein [Kiritimatiellia bacterium]
MERKTGTFALAAALCAWTAGSATAETVWLDQLSADGMVCGWGQPRVNKSVDGNALRIGSKAFERGVGTHSISYASFDVDGNAVAFDADVGIDAEVLPAGRDAASVRFSVLADGREVASSGVVKAGGESVHLHAGLAGAKRVGLLVTDADDGNTFDHADWANAFFTMKDGKAPVACKVSGEQLGILTPPAPAQPRINGARVFGARPGRPIVWRLPVTGERPLALSAEGLPPGATFDAEKGILGGAVAEPGTYRITFTAKNAKGSDTRALKLVVGDRIALTPPMGWNSWNCFAWAVTGQNIRDTIDVFDKSGLADHGWSYVNIDDYWQNKPSAKNDPTLHGPERNPDGSIAVNRRFPSMKGLADYAHSKGLKIGLYSSPGPYTCGRCVGSWGHEWQDAKTYADWGYDYLKYDWCSYGRVVVGDTEHGRHALPYRLMGEALKAQGRDIVFSLCQYGMGNVSTWGESVGGNCWRTTGDITDTWSSMWNILHKQKDSWPYARPGAWNDPDMLVVGRLGWGRLRPTRLTPNEQYTHMSLWSVLCSPLLIGCDLTQLDDFTMSLLTNDEVIETSQDELGAQAACVAKGPRAEIWAKPMSDGSLVFAMFNTFVVPTRITVDFASLGLEGRWRVRDLWRQEDAGVFSSAYSADVPTHATHLVRLFPEAGAGLAKGLGDIRDNAVYAAYAEKRPVDKPGYRAPSGWPCAECPRERSLR